MVFKSSLKKMNLLGDDAVSVDIYLRFGVILCHHLHDCPKYRCIKLLQIAGN
jgi:hypothetical protein